MRRLFRLFNNQKLMIIFVGTIATLFTLTIGVVYLISFLLGPPSLTNEQNTIYFGENGEIIGEERGSENRYWISLEQISPYIVDATLAVEDQHFYKHSGFDYRRIVSAALADLQSRSLREGASTLTQQYARNLFLTHEKTWLRKIKEAFYTVRIEMHYSKDEILEGYLNTIYFGHGSYGVEAASRYLFNKHADEVTIAEAAMLATIPKGPKYYSPLNDEKRANSRQKHILKLLKDQDKITEDEYNLAIAEELSYKRITETKDGSMTYFQDEALKEAATILDLDAHTIKSGGYEIYTTLNSTYQNKLNHKIAEEINDQSEIQIGAIAMDPHTGAIKALVGGRDYNKSPFNRAVAAKRMAGSTFKPFLYYAAIDQNYTPSTKLLSEPTTFELEDDIYKPSNFNNYYANKPITLAQALALSDNIYAVKTHLFLGIDQLVQTAEKFGINESLPAVPSLALGTASVTVKEMTTGYSMLANGGHEVHGYTVEKIVAPDGNVLFEKEVETGKQILDERTAFILTDLMTGMFDQDLNGHMAVTGAPISDKLSRQYAGKSGSTNYDSWMIGYSPSLVTSIWLGYDDHRELNHATDHSYAKDIWAQFMEEAHKDEEVQSFSTPNGLVRVPIDPATGQIATPYCPTSRSMYFKEGTEPKSHCMEHFPSDGEVDQRHEQLKANEKKGMLQKLFDLFFN